MNSVDADIPDCRYAIFSGGVGGAKLALGLYLERSSEELLVIGNVGDDFTTGVCIFHQISIP